MAKKKKKSTKKSTPLATASNGRGKNGKFIAGNSAAKGNPHAKKVAKLRSIMLGATSEADMRAITRKMISLAKGGDIAAAKLVWDRLLGSVTPIVAIDMKQAHQVNWDMLYLNRSQDGENAVDKRLSLEEEKDV